MPSLLALFFVRCSHSRRNKQTKPKHSLTQCAHIVCYYIRIKQIQLIIDIYLYVTQILLFIIIVCVMCMWWLFVLSAFKVLMFYTCFCCFISWPTICKPLPTVIIARKWFKYVHRGNYTELAKPLHIYVFGLSIWAEFNKTKLVRRTACKMMN